MPKVFTSDKQKIGEMGESIAVKFLMKHGFSILDRNYTKKWGEIDIVAQKDNKIYFIEVKSVSHLPYRTSDFDDNYNPEDNMHPWKMKRMARTVQTYLLDKKVDDEVEWQVDLLVVYLDLKTGKSEVKVVNDLIL